MHVADPVVDKQRHLAHSSLNVLDFHADLHAKPLNYCFCGTWEGHDFTALKVQTPSQGQFSEE
jgi:hypothetical protein